MKKILEKSGNFVRGKKWEPCLHRYMYQELQMVLTYENVNFGCS